MKDLDATYEAAWDAYVEASMHPEIQTFDCIKRAVDAAIACGETQMSKHKNGSTRRKIKRAKDRERYKARRKARRIAERQTPPGDAPSGDAAHVELPGGDA